MVVVWEKGMISDPMTSLGLICVKHLGGARPRMVRRVTLCCNLAVIIIFHLRIRHVTWLKA